MAPVRPLVAQGQRVLALTDASTDTILAESKALKVFVSQMARASGKRNLDSRSLGGTPLTDAYNAAVAAASAGDKAGANAAVKDIVSICKVRSVAPYGSDANPVVGGVTFSSMSGSRGTAGTW